MSKRLIWIIVILGLAGLGILFFRSGGVNDSVSRLMARGNAFLEQGDATNATTAYLEVVKTAPNDLYARLNLANAYLLASDAPQVIEQCKQALDLDHNSAAAYYLMGCAYLRASDPAQAVQALQQSEQIDPAVSALHFQLGLAQAQLGHVEEAINEFETISRFDPEHPSVHYQLSLLYRQAGRAEDAAREMQTHQELLARNPNRPTGPAVFERCKYTRPQIAFVLEQPDPKGVPVHFADATASGFSHAGDYRGPIAVLDYNHDGRNSLFVREGEKGFRVLSNERGHFQPLGQLLGAKPGADYKCCLVGDLDNDRFEDVVVLGMQASQVFKFATNGRARDYTASAGLRDLKARSGVLADMDFTGKLDLLTVRPDGGGLAMYQNLGNAYFQEHTGASGLPAAFAGAENVAVEDWNNDDVPGIFVTRANQPPAYFLKQRAGGFVATNLPVGWPSGGVIALGDLDNDLRSDLVLANDRDLRIAYGGTRAETTLSLDGLQAKGILLVDYDNDGWLDIIAWETACASGATWAKESL